MVATFPALRMRRMRRSETIRGMIRETTLSARDLVYPMFVVPGSRIRQEISSMPGCYHLSVDEAVRDAEETIRLGVPGIILFGLPPSKDPMGTGAYAEDGIIQEAVRAIKRALPELVVITDVCLCEYTDHGHCGVIGGDDVDNDRSLDLIARTALSHAAAGADLVAPSDMMDGRVKAIRQTLDGSGLSNVPVMSYAAKYASSFFGPFRTAADSAPQFGDRRGYQMDPANSREALREIEMDIEEGADIIMVKPALPYLDVLARARQSFNLPLAAYNVSGEYSMVKAAARNGWLEERRVVMETLISIKRAGADIILTYHARDAARWLSD